ncbi:odorant receptor 47a-like [Camponotus floridanus]|uniref:odorant receptor 47a-like n=1 Tax=Camponotus floridanus TaxID=104421 RepID=UPI000DC69E47|nr:odorant receptor 47a-like [Camponotus floridanus]
MKLQDICNGLKDENEIIIMKQYSRYGKRYAIAFIIFAVCCSFSITIAMFWSSILQITLGTNVTQSRRLPITMEYFIDQEKYFYWILLHIGVASFIGTIVILGIGSVLIMYVLHICGMFRISSYRIKRAMHINMLENIKPRKENLMLKGIISAVDIHRQAIKLSNCLVSKIETMMLCLIICGVLTLSLNLLRIFQIASYGDDVKEFLIPFILIIIDIVYMFIANYLGQNITDHNNDVFATVYDVQWHVAPLHIQKVILFLLQRGTKDFTISIGRLFVASLECFTTLVKTSVSYFTVVYSTQQ